MRHRLGAAPVAYLASVRPEGPPHVVPITLALARDVIYTAVDHKPKTTRALQRLDNVRANPMVSILADEYSDHWSGLWWVRADGQAEVHDQGPEWERGIQHLRAKYEQYRAEPPEGPVIAVAVSRWAGWEAGGRDNVP